MSNEKISNLLQELIEELEKSSEPDSSAIDQAKQLQKDLGDVLNPEVDTSENTILDDAIALEASFAVQHPVAEKLIRELVNTLSRIGI